MNLSNLPPGVRLSDPGGPDDPARIASERAEEALFNGFYDATRADFSVQEINTIWAEAAEQALADEREEEQDDEPEIDDEPPPDYGPPGSGAIITEYP